MDASPTGADGERPTELFLYARPGCALCDETRITLQALLARRASTGQPTPALIERDIEADPALERAFFAEIPVVELGGRRMTLAISPARIERLLADVLDR
jgi:hypothetical protein